MYKCMHMYDSAFVGYIRIHVCESPPPPSLHVLIFDTNYHFEGVYTLAECLYGFENFGYNTLFRHNIISIVWIVYIAIKG